MTLLSISPETVRTHGRERGHCSGIDKSNNELSVHSRRGIESDMSHIFWATVPCWSEVTSDLPLSAQMYLMDASLLIPINKCKCDSVALVAHTWLASLKNHCPLVQCNI